MRPEDLARLATLEEMHTERAVTLAANWPGDEADAFHHAGIVLALRTVREAATDVPESVKDVQCPQCRRPFVLRWNDERHAPATLNIRSCPSGGVYDVAIRCPHCNFEEPL